MLEVMGVVKANEQMLKDSKQWHKDIQAVAMATSCIAEFISMQTAIDKNNNQAHSNLATEVDERFRIATMAQSAAVTARMEDSLNELSTTQLPPTQIELKPMQLQPNYDSAGLDMGTDAQHEATLNT